LLRRWGGVGFCAMKFPFKIFLTRAGWVYVTLFLFPGPFDSIPYLSQPVADLMLRVWGPLVRTLASMFSIELPAVLAITGAGDGLYNWLLLALQFALAFFVSLAWTLKDRGSKSLMFESVARDYLRLNVMALMIVYGFDKIFCSQFGFLDDIRLYSTFAEVSPMGLAWRFMAFSPAYQIFGGAAEAIGAILLLWRRTTTLGALILAGVLTNVVVLNFCFDIPVKILSSHLLVFSVVLAGPDLKRLMHVLLGGPKFEGPSSTTVPYFSSGRQYRLFSLVMVLFVALGIGGEIARFVGMKVYQRSSDLDGVYEVVPSAASAVSWRRVEFRGQVMQAQNDKSKRENLLLVPDETKKHISLKQRGEDEAGAFTYSQQGDFLTLIGTLRGESMEIDLRKLDPQNTPLISRGFHWVQEVPSND
jgi:hypothetical protein